MVERGDGCDIFARWVLRRFDEVVLCIPTTGEYTVPQRILDSDIYLNRIDIDREYSRPVIR